MTVGQYLKMERELRGITLDHVASVTKISPHILAFIETDQFDKLPSRTFAKGFVNAYAKSIGLNPDEAVLRYDEVHSVKITTPNYSQLYQQHKVEKTAKNTEKPAKPKREFRIAERFKKIHVSGKVIFIIIAALVVAAAYFASR